MKPQLLLLTAVLLSSTAIYAQDNVSDAIVFKGKEITFKEHPGLVFRLSEPYLRYQPWDKAHTGDATCSVALEVANNSEDNISGIDFFTKVFDKKKKVVWEGTNGIGPQPGEGMVIKPGGKSINDAFVNKDKAFCSEYGKVEFRITEVKTASASLTDKPVFPEEWLSFDGHAGLEFRLSKPYIWLDDLSGNERFAIAMEFKNSGDPVKFVYFNVKVYDDQGVFFEGEKQEHNGRYLPSPRNFMDPKFPANYTGINKNFYTAEKSFLDKFKKIEIDIAKVE